MPETAFLMIASGFRTSCAMTALSSPTAASCSLRTSSSCTTRSSRVALAELLRALAELVGGAHEAALEEEADRQDGDERAVVEEVQRVTAADGGWRARATPATMVSAAAADQRACRSGVLRAPRAMT